MIPYEGTAPYIFISYAHKDTSRVLPIVEALEKNGFRVWYDAGIEAGTEWPENIASHLAKASVVLAFLSPSAIASQNCRQEITFALSRNRALLAVYLDELTLPLGMEMQLGLTQSLFYYRHPTRDAFVAELLKSSLLSPCRAAVSATKPTVNRKDYKIEDGVLVEYLGRGGEVVIPDGVYEIGESAFYLCSELTSVVIPDRATLPNLHPQNNYCTL